MIRKLQSTLEASGIEWPALGNHIPCIAHVIQLALGAFISSLGVKGCTKSWEAHEHDQQFGENDSIDIGKSQRLRKEGNARINKVSTMRPSLAKIIEKVRISTYCECLETDHQIAENACCVDYSDMWSSKLVHWMSQDHSSNLSTTYYRCEDTVELDTGVTWAGIPIMRIHPLVAQESKIQWIPAALHNTRWMDHHPVCNGSVEAIPVLDRLDV